MRCLCLCTHIPRGLIYISLSPSFHLVKCSLLHVMAEVMLHFMAEVVGIQLSCEANLQLNKIPTPQLLDEQSSGV